MSLKKFIEYSSFYGVPISTGLVPGGSGQIAHAERVRDTWEIDVGDDPDNRPAPRRVAYFVTNYAGRYKKEYGIVVAIDQAGHPPYGRELADAVFRYYIAYFEAISDRRALPYPPYGCHLVGKEQVKAEGSVRGVVGATIALL